MSDVSKFPLRLPTEVYDKIKELADKDDRSINNYLVMIIKDHVNKTN